MGSRRRSAPSLCEGTSLIRHLDCGKALDSGCAVSACACGSYMFAFMRSIRLQVERTTIVLWVSCTHSTSARRIRRKKWRSDFASFRSDPLVRRTPVRSLLSLRPRVAAVGARWRINPRGVMADLPVRYRTLSSMINRYEYLRPHVLASGVNRQAGAVYLLVQRCGNPALIQDSQELEIQAEPIFILASSTFDTTRRKGPS